MLNGNQNPWAEEGAAKGRKTGSWSRGVAGWRAPQSALLICDRRVGSGATVHGELSLWRLLWVDGVHGLLLKHRPIACRVVWEKQQQGFSKGSGAPPGADRRGGCDCEEYSSVFVSMTETARLRDTPQGRRVRNKRKHASLDPTLGEISEH